MESLEEQKAIGTGDSPAMSPSKKKKKRNRKSLEDVENVNPESDKSGAVLESLPVGSQKQSNELEQKSVIFESNGVGNADVPKKKKKNKKKKKKGNDNADNSNVLKSPPVNGHKQSDEPESVISEGSVGGNANVPTPSKKKNKKNKKNVNAEKSSVLEIHPLNGHEQSDKSNDIKPVSESGGGGKAAAAKKKKKFRKRKEGKIANDSGDVGEKDEGESGAKRMKMDDNMSATGGQPSAVLAVPGGVVEKGEPVAGKKKRKKKNRGKKAAGSLDVAEIKDAGDEPEVKRLKVDAENNDVVDSSAVSATGESVAGKKKRKKKNKVKKAADKVEAEEMKEVGEEPKVKRLKVETDSDLVNSSVVSATQISTAGESDGPVSVPCETASAVNKKKKKKKKNKRTSGASVGEIQEAENVTEEQGKTEIASEKTESELKGEIEDVVEEQEGIELKSEKEGDTTVSENEKPEENEIDSGKMDNVDENEIGGDKQYDADTSQIEETIDVEKKKKKKKKKGANSEVNQDVTEEKIVLPVPSDVVAKEPEILSEKEDATGADDVEEKTPKKKKKKNKKAKESSEDVQSADAQEESKADADGQSANEVEESKAEVDVQSASNVEESPGDSNKKKKKRKKKGKGNDSADWTVTDIGEPSVKEAENQDGTNESSKSVEPAVPIPVSLSRMYVDPPMKEEITKSWTEGSPLQKESR